MTKIEMLKLFISAVTPIIILIIGTRFNKILEINKAEFSKIQNWQNIWAKRFLDIAFDYNTAISEIVCTLSKFKDIPDKDSENIKKINEELIILIRKLQYLEWEIKNFSRFAPKKGNIVKIKAENLLSLIDNLLKDKKGDLEKIREMQFEFNDAIKFAHAEILEIDMRQTRHAELVSASNQRDSNAKN